MEKWILVADTEVCELSKQQVNICKSLDVPLKGAIMCNSEENKNTPICNNIDYFPSFCHTETSVCVPGIRRTDEEFKELNSILKKELDKR